VNLNPADFGKLGERVVYLTHILYVKRFSREEGKRSLAEWVPLKAEHLRRIIGKAYYAATMEACLEAGVLEIDERRHYSAGRYPNHYRIGERFREASFELFEVRNRYLRENLSRHRMARQKGAPPVYQHVMHWLDQLTIADIPDCVIRQAANDAPRRRKSKESRDATKQYEFLLHQIENIRQKAIPPSRDKYGRLHSVVTNLKSTFRPYLRINGDALVSVDIKTSQPLFLGLFVEAYLRIDRKLPCNNQQFTSKHPIQSTTTNPNLHIHSHPHPLMMSTKPNNVPGSGGVTGANARPADLQRYFDEVEKGDLYDFLQRETGYVKMTRDEFKHGRVFGMLYGKNKWAGKLYKAMGQCFPTVVRVMREVKGTDLLSPEPEQFKWLAHEMQRAEADFIFNRVVARLLNDYPEIPVVTLHDCVFTTAGNESAVERVMREEFEELGVNPQLHIETFSEGALVGV
jgi:hypothetical protein